MTRLIQYSCWNKNVNFSIWVHDTNLIVANVSYDFQFHTASLMYVKAITAWHKQGLTHWSLEKSGLFEIPNFQLNFINSILKISFMMPYGIKRSQHFKCYFRQDLYIFAFYFILPHWNCIVSWKNPDSKVHGGKMGPTWVLSAPDGPHESCYQGTYLNYIINIMVADDLAMPGAKASASMSNL